MPLRRSILRPRFSPKMIAGLQLWLDAADSSTITLNGSNVSEWRDKSGNNIAVLQATANNQPSYESAYVNGKNAIKFDGNDWLFQSSLALNNSTCTVFAVVREDAYNLVSGCYVFGPESVSDYETGDSFFFEYGSDTDLVRYNNSAGLSEYGSGTMPLSVCVINQASSSCACRRNGTQTGSNVGIRNSTSQNFVISTRIVNGAPWAGLATAQTFCEMIRYSSSLSDSQVSTVEKYLAKKWGITLA